MRNNIKGNNIVNILSLIASIFTIISVIVCSAYVVNNINQNSQTMNDSEISSNITDSTNSNIYINCSVNISEDQIEALSGEENELLLEATKAFISGNFSTAKEIYLKLKNNKYALNNLGYIYSQGLGVNRNLEIAAEFYEKSGKLGYNQAIINRVALDLINPTSYKRVFDALSYGFEKKNFETIKFMACYIDNSFINETDTEILLPYAEEFQLLADSEKKVKLDAMLYDEVIEITTDEKIDENSLNDFCSYISSGVIKKVSTYTEKDNKVLPVYTVDNICTIYQKQFIHANKLFKEAWVEI